VSEASEPVQIDCRRFAILKAVDFGLSEIDRDEGVRTEFVAILRDGR
jgi:hypothetical protein